MNWPLILKRLSRLTMVSCLSLALMTPLADTHVSYAQEVEGQLEDEVTTRGLKRKMPRSATQRSRVMKKVLPSTQKPATTHNPQLQNLQRQIQLLQAQVNALRAVIQISNGVTTVSSKVLRLQGDAVTVKSLKDGVTIESRKNVKIESQRDVSMKASKQVDIQAGNNLNIRGNGTTNVRGTVIKLNNGGKPVARLGSKTMSPPVGGIGSITSGSPTVFVP